MHGRSRMTIHLRIPTMSGRGVHLSATRRVATPKAAKLTGIALKQVESLGYAGASSPPTRRREPTNPPRFLRSAMACE